MKKTLFFSLALLLFTAACKKENEDTTTENQTSTTDSTVTTGSTGSTSTGNTTTPVTYPSTYVVINNDTMWMVSKTQLNDPYKFRYQINFGTKSQLSQNVAEVGQNSTIGFGLSFIKKPVDSGSFNYTSSRSSIDTTQVNLYVSFFLNTGYSIENENYLSPDNGALNLTLNAGELDADFGTVILSNEADTTQKLTLHGILDFKW